MTGIQISGGSPIMVERNMPMRGRALRRPQHRFNLVTRPWQIQPMLIAPVLPGETMSNLLLQSRAVSDPLASKLIGWWKEYYFFYVKLRDLEIADDLTNMLVTGASTSGLASAASVPHYYRGDGINYSLECLKRVVDEYFRDEDEAWNVVTSDGLPHAAINIQDYTQSLIADGASNSTEEEMPGENPTLPAHMSAFSDHFAHWEAMRDSGLVEATFEDWLKTFGVSAPRAVQERDTKPELLRYIREWTYPANTINPATGAASSAASWSIAERADKDRFFREPGFIFGVTVTRPKVYKSSIEAAGAHYLDLPYMWLPAVLQDAPYTSLREFTATNGPLAAVQTGGYWVDMRDLYLHGDQFVNHDFTATDDNSVALPSDTEEGNYATGTMADTLFAAASPANKIREDGVVSLTIKSASANKDWSL